MGRDDNLWFCSNCRSGPIGIWQDNCPLCGAARLEYISYRLAEPDKLEAQIAKERKATVQGSLKPQKARQSIPRPATELRRQILATFGTANPKITVEDVVKVTLTMEWDPVQFYEDCFSSVEYNVFAQEAIVFTGTERNAEATTVSKYIARNWPHLKDVILRALQSLKDPKFGLNEQFGAASSLQASRLPLLLPGNRFFNTRFSVCGNMDWVADAAEALSWLGAALRPSTLQSPDDQHKVSCCTPSLECTPRVEPSGMDTKFDILCTFDQVPADTTIGICWYDMFPHKLLVQGFPVPEKPSHMRGVELPLAIMVSTIGAQHVTVFNNNLLIKGFNRMLVMTGRDGVFCQWHYVFNKNSHIRYADIADNRVRNSNPYYLKDDEYEEWLQSSRHIVGWWNDVQLSTGPPEANYNVSSVLLQDEPKEHSVDRITISIAKIVGIGLSGIVAQAPKCCGIASGDFMSKMENLNENPDPVVIYDTAAKRAWMMDAPGALLHLLRASIWRNLKSEKAMRAFNKDVP
ncbi:hypothetical protein HBH71_038800 [Parastagonospora nodorum]|nr:hypothetical protein HBH71_038800 [Parastagonospora nodorum]KAH5482213.1 hypothetical protein HBI28_005460 [Parastagonospora nodorum]KAH5647796.1 hypothetical protein HBI22_018000 [Parastagonospora nodorum]